MSSNKTPRVAARWLRRVAMSPVEDALQTLDTLEELSDNLTRIEDTFAQHFKFAVDAPNPEVQSQMELLGKATSGLQSAKEALLALNKALEVAPEEKALQQAIEKATIMVSRFEKHADAARKIIRSISKKSMPPALKKMAAAVSRLIEARLVNPDVLQVIPWQKNTENWHTRVKGVAYQVVFRIDDPEYLKTHERRNIEHLANLTLEEDTTDTVGVTFIENPYASGRKPAVAAQVADMFFKQLTGWPGLKGEAEETEKRKKLAPSIAFSLNAALQRANGFDARKAEISDDFLNIEGSYRSNSLPKEGAYSVGEAEYDEMVSKELKRFHSILDPIMQRYKDDIQEMHVTPSEKSWIDVYITLK